MCSFLSQAGGCENKFPNRKTNQKEKVMLRLSNILIKCAREQKRDLWVLGLSLAFAPLFVFIYWLMTSAGGSTTYGVLVLNQDQGVMTAQSERMNDGNELVERMRAFSYENGLPFLKLIEVDNRPEAETRLRNRDAAALIIIPSDFSAAMQAIKTKQKKPPTILEVVGDLTNPTYTIAAVSVMSVADQYLLEISGEIRPVTMVETPLGASAARTEFENYMPGLLIFAVVLMVFQAAMMVARESEGGKLIRLRLAGISSFELLGGISVWLVIVGVVSVVLTFLTALVCGFCSQGSILLALVITIITCFSIIGVGLIVASFAKTVSHAFVIANFPLGFLMFLTGAVFPLPRTTLFNLLGHNYALNDILPPTHAVIALNKIFTLGAGFGDVLFELCALTVLSALFFGIGVVLFQRMNLR
jgi:ABC-2 type transport system permease protein